jgi:hypothetical protein
VRRLLDSKQQLLIGVVHLRPLPGAPRWRGDIDTAVERALADAQAYERGGAHAIVVENFGDVPFAKGSVPPETVAAMAVVGLAIRATVKPPMGFNVLRNDAHAALALCTACGGEFIRVNVHCGAMLTDQGIIEGQAHDTLRLRERLCPGVQILADVHVKHGVALGNWPLEVAARDTLERGLADGLIVSGSATGIATALDDVKRVRAACPRAKIFLGSGVTAENLRDSLPLVDGVIVGTSLKRGGRVENPVDARRVARLAKALKESS